MGGMLERAFGSAMEAVDKKVGWDKLPVPLGLLSLLGIRYRLQSENLYDTGVPEPPDGQATPDPRWLKARTLDGSYNDLKQPMMGAMNTRFGRNIPLEETHPEEPPRLLTPSPRTISRELLQRDEFIPATTLNVIAAAWIQFEVHDWVFHGHNEDADPWELECGEDDDWHTKPMTILRTRHDPEPSANGGPSTWVNTQTHWWDASQVYGPDLETAQRIRSGELGKIDLDEHGLIPPEHEPSDPDYAGRPGTVWLGYSALHSLFMREHNAVCDHLHERYPELGDEELYDKARLVVAGLIAKIHTVEWTPAIILHPTTVRAMHANWWGLAGERIDRKLGRRTKNHMIRGLVGAPTHQHGVPYALTEEFVSVYRMHPLIPDSFVFRSAGDGSVLAERSFRDLQVPKIRERLGEMSWADVFYSLGNLHPGALTLHNYPKVLQEFHRPDGEVVDLAATDILRVRERGVPRYQRFRELFHLRKITSFEELCDQPEWVEELKRVYDDDLDAVDLMVGMFAETKPKGFGFSDTAFRVFVLMASRRLEADRFFTVDYRPEVYTQAGLDWIDNNTMKSVLVRHYPELETALQGVENAFAPWNNGTG
jgi:hypothetical protein